MIQIYQKPTESNPTIAFTWADFREFKMYMQDKKFENVPTAQKFFYDYQCWILVSAFEEFIIFFEDATKDSDLDITIRDVVNAMREASIKTINHKENLDIILETIVEKANFMRVLVKATEGVHFPVMKMMATKILTYCREQIDERQKNKNKAESG